MSVNSFSAEQVTTMLSAELAVEALHRSPQFSTLDGLLLIQKGRLRP